MPIQLNRSILLDFQIDEAALLQEIRDMEKQKEDKQNEVIKLSLNRNYTINPIQSEISKSDGQDSFSKIRILFKEEEDARRSQAIVVPELVRRAIPRP